MKKPMYLFLAVFVIMLFVALFVGTAPVYAFRPGPPPPVRGGFWFGPGWGPWWWGGPLVYPFYDYPRQPIVIEQQPPVYDQQMQQQVPEEPYYWYYCAESKTYYPYVKQCPKGWMKVVPTPPPTPTPAQPKGGE
jgi:hypothetical protein